MARVVAWVVAFGLGAGFGYWLAGIAAGAYNLYYLGKKFAVTIPRRGRFLIR